MHRISCEEFVFDDTVPGDFEERVVTTPKGFSPTSVVLGSEEFDCLLIQD